MSWHKIDNMSMRMAAEVSDYMQNELPTIDMAKYYEALEHGIPHGDLAYGMALVDWNENGKPSNAWFSYAPGQHECKLLIAFRKEISAKFGLEILTTEEGEERRKKEPRINTKKVYDWRLN